MLVYRISRTQYIHDLNGTGARLFGGRWNKPGVSALYTSQHKSLAMLELIVHFNAREALKLDYSFLTLEIPDHLIVKIPESLIPSNWETLNNAILWKITEDYFYKKNAPAICVPSALIDGEFNYIINPLNAAFQEIRTVLIESTRLDNRFEKSMN